MRPSSDEPEWSQWQDWRSNSSKFCYERGEEPGKSHANRWAIFDTARNGNDSIDSLLAHLNVSQKINSISGKLIEIRERVCIKKNGTEDKQ